MEKTYVFCDISGSTTEWIIGKVHGYHSYVLSLIIMYKIDVFHEWNSECGEAIDKKTFIINREKNFGTGGTNPDKIIPHLKSVDVNSHLIIVTDGQTSPSISKKMYTDLTTLGKKFSKITFIIRDTFGVIDLTCGLAFRDFCETFELISPTLNSSFNFSDLLSSINSIKTVPDFQSKSKELLEAITLFCQGIKSNDNSKLVDATNNLKKRLSLSITTVDPSTQISTLSTCEEITQWCSNIHQSHYSNDLSYGSQIEKLIQIVNGSLLNNFSLNVGSSITGFALTSASEVVINDIGINVDDEFNVNVSIGGDYEFNVDVDVIDGNLKKFLYHCPILESEVKSFKCIPLKDEVNLKFLPEGNQADFRRNPLVLLPELEHLSNPFLSILSLIYIKKQNTNKHPSSRIKIYEHFLIFPAIELGDEIMKKAIAYNNKVLQKYITEKSIGNPNSIFVIFYFLAKKFEYLSDCMKEFEDQLVFRMKNSFMNASILGSTSEFPNSKMSFISAILFVLESSRTSLSNSRNPFLAHIGYSDYLVKISTICGYTIDPLIIKYIHILKCHLRLVSIFKKYQGKKNPIIYLVRCFNQKIMKFDSPEIFCGIIPLDGNPTKESQSFVMNKLSKLGIFDISFDELCYLVQLIEPNYLTSFVSQIIVSNDVKYSDLINYSNLTVNMSNWKITNFTDEELRVEIVRETGKPVPVDESVKTEKWGHKYLSCTKNFQELVISLERFPTFEELVVYVYKNNIRYGTLPNQFEEYCNTTITDYTVIYPDGVEFLLNLLKPVVVE
jgi:hypothetical protein